MRDPAADAQMLDAAQQSRHRIDIGDVGGDDERRRGQRGQALEAAFSEARACQRVRVALLKMLCRAGPAASFRPSVAPAAAASSAPSRAYRTLPSLA